MKNQALNHFINEISQAWGPVNAELTKTAKRLLEELIVKGKNEDWVLELLENKSPDAQVYRNEEHGFILQAHVEQDGEMSPPHDHGNGWVIYATVQGQVEMGIYHKVIRPDGSMVVVQKDKYVQQPGQCHVYLEGDIHDTKTVADNTLMLRLTSCDFHQEFAEGRLVRFLENAEKW